jgi:pilus assembly protein CpaF
MYQPFVAVPSYESSEQREAPPWAHPAGDIARTVPIPHPPEQRTGPVPRPHRHAYALGTDDSVPSGLAAPETDALGARSATFGVPPINTVMPAGRRRDPAAPPDAEILDVSALGPLSPFAAEPGITDLFVNGEAGLWTDAGPGLLRRPEWTSTEPAIRALAVRLVALGGRHIDEASPCVDVRLADGIRVHAVLPPISSTGTLLSIRLPHADRFSLNALAANGLCGADDGYLERLRAAVASRRNILITGAAGSGKTTLLAALCSEAPPEERIVVIEDVAELRIAHPHVVALESRQANLEGAGRVGLESLVREALRMRPDRLVLGECRGGEIRELLAALNTGHDGGAGTLHANSLRDVPARLEALGALAGMSPDAVARQTISAINVVLHLERQDGVRRIAQLGRFRLDSEGRLAVEAV